MTEHPDGQPERQQGAQATAALSRELGELLIQLSIAVHRYAMYPPGHPSLQPAAENVLERLGALFEHRERLSIGVAQSQLVIEGVATDEKHPVLADLARRLHDHQLGAITFERAVEQWELEEMLATLAKEIDENESPIGRGGEQPDWDNIHLFGLGYGQLSLEGGPAETVSAKRDRATELWLGLARSAMASDEDFSDGAPSAGEVAESIKAHKREAAYDQVIVGYMLQLSEEIKGGAKEAAEVRRRVSKLIDELDEGTLESLVEMGGDLDQRRKFVLNASESFAAESVVKVLNAAASSEEQSISNSMQRLLTKLASHADSSGGRVRHQADDALRENVEELLADWQLEDPNPDAYTLVLDGMAKAAPILTQGRDLDDLDGGLSGAERLVQMSLEIDAFGPIIYKAISDAMVGGKSGELIEMLEEAPDDSRAAIRLRSQLTDPVQLRKLLSGESVDEEALARIADAMGDAAIDPLLDVLAESDSRSIRRAVFDVLAQRAEGLGARVASRLDDSRWFVIRNLLALLQSLDDRPADFDPSPFLAHEDARVRREAIPLALKEPHLRERALATALADSDERMVRLALSELGDSVPETLLPVIAKRVVRGEHSEEVRALGVRALGGSGSGLALETLLGVAVTGKTLLGRIKLASKSQEMIAALEALTRGWASDSRVAAVLSEATRSKDPEIKRAVLRGAGE